MKAVRFALASFAATTVVLLADCQHPENYRWAGSAGYVVTPEASAVIAEAEKATGTNWHKPGVEVYTFPTPAKESSKLTVTGLSDHGQAALIAALSQKGAKPGEMMAALAKSLSAKPPSTSSATERSDQSQFDRTLVATVSKGLDAKPGDRLMWAWILVKPVNFEFTGYTVIATDNQTLNIEHVSNETTTQVQGQISATLPGPAQVSPSASASAQNVYTTSADINQQYTKLGADIYPRFLRIYRESERNQDVAGNTLISLSAVVNPEHLQPAPSSKFDGPFEQRMLLASSANLRSDKGTPLGASAASLSFALTTRPLPCPLTAMVSLVYQLRRITRNETSYVEGEQYADIEKGATPWIQRTIAAADEVAPPTWALFPPLAPGKPALLHYALHARTINDERLPLAFSDYETARNAASWINAHHSPTLGKDRVRLSFADGVSYRLSAQRVVTDPSRQKAVCDSVTLKPE